MKIKELYTRSYFNLAILIIRLWTGVVMFKYSTDYLFNGKISGLISFLESLEWPYPEVMAYASQISELIASILILLGVRLGAFILAFTMLVAVIFAHKGLIFTEAETPFNYFIFALILSFTGMGKPALDSYISRLKRIG